MRAVRCAYMATPICTTRVQLRTCTSRRPPEPHTQKPILKLKTQRKHHSIRPPHKAAQHAQSRPHTADVSLMDLAGRTVIDMHSESSGAVDIDGGDADMRSSATEQRQQEEQQQQGDATVNATSGRGTAGGDAPEDMVRILTLKHVRYEITLDEIECGTLSAVSIIASSNYSNTGNLYVACTCMCCCCNLRSNLCI